MFCILQGISFKKRNFINVVLLLIYLRVATFYIKQILTNLFSLLEYPHIVLSEIFKYYFKL